MNLKNFEFFFLIVLIILEIFFCKIIIKYIILFFFLQYCTSLGFILDSKCTENRPVFDVRHGDEWEKKGALNDSENDEDEKEREE